MLTITANKYTIQRYIQATCMADTHDTTTYWLVTTGGSLLHQAVAHHAQQEKHKSKPRCKDSRQAG